MFVRLLVAVNITSKSIGEGADATRFWQQNSAENLQALWPTLGGAPNKNIECGS